MGQTLDRSTARRWFLFGRLLTQIAVLWLVSVVGEWVVARAHLPLPGNVFGMVLLFALLSTGAIREHWIADGAGVLTRHLAFFFIPIAVGLMQWGSLFWREGHWLLSALVLSTLAALLTTGLIVRALSRTRERHEEHAPWPTSAPLRSRSPSPSAPMR